MKKLRSISCEKGKSLRLEVTFVGTPRVNVTWQKDGKLIWASYQYNVITTDTSCILEVLNSDRMEAAGMYSCEVDNGVGNDKCEGKVLILGKVTQMHALLLLFILNPPSHRLVPERESQLTTVLVVIFYSERPYFTEEPKPQEVLVGDAITLMCRIAGTPDISVTWFKGDGKLRQSPICLMDYLDGVATLKLTQTTKFDRGEYVCKAENRVGWASASCNLLVKGDASFLFSVFGEILLPLSNQWPKSFTLSNDKTFGLTNVHPHE